MRRLRRDWCWPAGPREFSYRVPGVLHQRACRRVRGAALVADGVLGLDADIEDYLTSWRLPASCQGWRPQATLRQLLAHTAGLSYNWFRCYAAGEPVPSLLQTLRGEAPANTPAGPSGPAAGQPVPVLRQPLRRAPAADARCDRGAVR